MSAGDLTARCAAVLDAVPHDDDCVNVHFPDSGRCCDCDRPTRQAAAMAREQRALLRFAARIIDETREGTEPDGGDVQDWAVEAGLLVPTPVTEACGEECACAAWDDFPQTCYRDSPALAAARWEESPDDAEA
jgi:hypothetical protein